MGEHGIKETKDVVAFVLKMATAGAKSLEDDKITIGDIPHFIAPLSALPAAISGIGEVPDEIKDLEPAEIAELKDFISIELDFPNADHEEIAQKAVDVMFGLYDLVMAVKDLIDEKDEAA